MKVRISKSRKMPVLFSYYLSNFGESTLEFLKESKPFSAYHKDTKEYECTEEVYSKIFEPTTEVIDERSNYAFTKFERKNFDKFGYQQDAVDFAMTRNNVFVNFPQGMGKSYTTMKIALAKKYARILVICGQSNLQEEWLKDANKHNVAQLLNVGIVGEDTGASTSKKIAWLHDRSVEPRLDLINIEALRNVSIVEALNAIHYDCIVVDEIQSAKGWKAEQTKGLHELVRYEGQDRIALSGTPVLNNPLEFFSFLRYFGMLEDTVRTTFEKYYGIWTFDFWGHYVCSGYRNLDKLAELVSPITCYVDKSELNLPPKTRKKISLPFAETDEYLKLKSLYKATTARIRKAGYSSKSAIRAQMRYISSTCPEKLAYVTDLCRKAKVLLFSQYTSVLDYYLEKLEAAGIRALYYHGKLSMKERLEVLSRWRTGEYDVLLLSIMTARYGLNLTESTDPAFVDSPTSLAILEQAEDRSHRIGQTKPVTSHLLCSTELDEQDLENIANKQEALESFKAYNA